MFCLRREQRVSCQSPLSYLRLSEVRQIRSEDNWRYSDTYLYRNYTSHLAAVSGLISCLESLDEISESKLELKSISKSSSVLLVQLTWWQVPGGKQRIRMLKRNSYVTREKVFINCINFAKSFWFHLDFH